MNDSFPEMASKASDGDLRAAASMLRLIREWTRIVSSGDGCPEEVSKYFSSIASECDRACAFCDGFAEGLRAPRAAPPPPPKDW